MKTIRLLLKLAASIIIWCVCPSLILYVFVQPGKVDSTPLALAMLGAWLATIAAFKLVSHVRRITAELAAQSIVMSVQTERQSELIDRLNRSTCILSEMREKLQAANTALATQSAWISSQQTCWACSEKKKIMDSNGAGRNNTDV